jgi:hypothetical protein
MAILLAAILAAGASLALRTGLDASQRINERADAHAEGRAALAVLSADLSAAFLSGANTELTLFEGHPVEEIPPGEPFLSFTTLSFRRARLPGTAPQPRSDAVRVDYLVVAGPDGTLPLPLGGAYPLLVRRARWLTESGPGQIDVVAERVAGLRLGYAGTGEPRPFWSAAGTDNPPLKVTEGEGDSSAREPRELPHAVEVTLLLAPPPKDEEQPKPRAYHTTIALAADAEPPFQPELVPPQTSGPAGSREGRR